MDISSSTLEAINIPDSPSSSYSDFQDISVLDWKDDRILSGHRSDRFQWGYSRWALGDFDRVGQYWFHCNNVLQVGAWLFYRAVFVPPAWLLWIVNPSENPSILQRVVDRSTLLFLSTVRRGFDCRSWYFLRRWTPPVHGRDLEPEQRPGYRSWFTEDYSIIGAVFLEE